MIPVGVVAEGVAIKSGLTEVVETVKMLRRQLIVGELVVTERIVVRDLVSQRVSVTKPIVGERILCDTVTGQSAGVAREGVPMTRIMASIMRAAVSNSSVAAKSMRVQGVR
jgi:hypothetical protein